MVFYAEPITLAQTKQLKSVPDEHSMQASWFSEQELEQMNSEKKLRFDEPLTYARYISSGGLITPVSLVSDWIPSSPPDVEEHRHFQIIDGSLTKF